MAIKSVSAWPETRDEIHKMMDHVAKVLLSFDYFFSSCTSHEFSLSNYCFFIISYTVVPPNTADLGTDEKAAVFVSVFMIH